MKNSGERGLDRASRTYKLFDYSSMGWLATFFVIFSGLSNYLGGDGTPDFKIYHFYNGYAALSGGRPQDIAAAQLQTYFVPVADAVYFFFIRWLNDWPDLSKVIFSLPNVFAAYLAFRIAMRLLPADWPWRNLIAGLLAAYGCLGASMLPTLGTCMSELVAGDFVLVAVLVCLSREESNEYAATSLAGVSCGAAVGLKLTCLPMFVGLLVALGVSYPGHPRIALRHCVIFGALGVLACFAVAGWWWLHVYRQFGDPVFPAFNDIFRSDLVAGSRWSDDRFKPTGWMTALFYPAYWAFQPTTRVIELNMRDSRILIGLVASLIILGISVLGRWRRPTEIKSSVPKLKVVFVAIFFVISYALWEDLFSIYRYLSVLEALSGVLAVSALASVFPQRFSRFAVPGFVVLLGLSALTTVYPWWSRSAEAKHIVEASVPPVSPDSMILMLDPYAMSYLVPFFPPSVRVIGANTNLVRPGSVGRLEKDIEAAINGQAGPLWGLEAPSNFPGVADTTLKHYRLERVEPCTPVSTNIDAPITIACRLTRQRPSE